MSNVDSEKLCVKSRQSETLEELREAHAGSLEREVSQPEILHAYLLCRICGKKHPHEEIRNLNIYAFGSEGVNICHSCEMSVVEFLRALSGVGSRAKLQGYRTGKEAMLRRAELKAARHNDRTDRPSPQ